MQKRLTRHGNSLALVIDKSMRRMLAFGPSRVVDVTTDGRRLVIEPVHERNVVPTTPPPEPACPLALILDAPKDVSRLEYVHGMGEELFLRLEPEMPRLGRYILWMQPGLTEDLLQERPGLVALMRRMHECVTLLDAGASWDDAIAEALRRVPPTGAKC